ncbi:2-keto-4-pentenoate hydratase/2-oxohepta-3-ene-1,7-dioic acid hydratase in catechol pathway [Paraburkholderia sp. BL6669N2]|uniref:fumarylacetoacetate hydrolase family protein n=1 Tax=unclassified Paraburkholderia TaxID=2615204 RepID=UPI000E22D50C|nr:MULTISPECIES: fumarylacetoacetate hydrolase family protein [unclassified Paraburkholderia]REG48852.1 2-keto-4-pentenoate hydratase/2-oxohepta-3-ene-1,7-dioic acid hydratase in catechol pathway [Paraburkholderia sp. BL6669N2]TDY21325.1 2-keto-4-pentenoate hydratase/2-oxohepta-3-ene-1,7-dioic acid hydratase in catechol pathway [Paraburkholderia sp. BL6665CI2N2]
MKLASFSTHLGPSFGIVLDETVFDLGKRLGGRYPDLKALIAADAFGEAAQAADSTQGDYPLSEVTLLPVIPNPEQIFCVGLNYADHVKETNRETTEHPVIFMRVPASQVGHGQPMLRPPESQKFDYEGEIAVIIGRGGRRIAEADAWNHIAGYACYNDGSVRDWQLHTGQWGPGKNFYRTGAFGPWMVTSDEIEPNAVMTLITRLNGQEVQRATTQMLIHGIAKQIAYLSTFTPLSPGDVIVTGTPGGVGAKRSPPLFMRAGDVAEVEVDRIGVLSNPIADEA